MKKSAVGSQRYVVAVVLSVVLVLSPVCEGKRTLGGGGRKTSSPSGGYSTRRQPQTSVTKPTYNTNSGNSHAEQAKLSYPNYNSQPNRPANAPSQNSQSQPIGWNVPNQGHSAAGPPPAYSPSNVAGGAKTNVHEPPPVYSKPNYAAPPPNYAQATGTQYGGAPTYHNPGQMPAGATYHSPNNLPPGATYYNSPAHVPGGYSGGYPAGGYPMQPGGYHAPAGAAHYPPANSVPAGATYVPAGGALPPGAVMYSAPPQQTSSGLGFGSGLAAGAIGGAILGHVLTPSHTSVAAPAPAPAAGNAAGGGDRIIIINNGQPVNATDVNGATVINTAAPANPDTPAAPGAAPASSEAHAPLAPMVPVPNDMSQPQNVTSGDTPMPPAAAAPEGSPAAAPMNPEQQQPPPPGGIICVPVRVNDTDPNDATKMIEVEKIACYPAPPPPPAAAPEAMDANTPAVPPQTPAEGSAPLAPLQPVTGGSQQLQQATLIGDQSVKDAASGAGNKQDFVGLLICFIASYLVVY